VAIETITPKRAAELISALETAERDGRMRQRGSSPDRESLYAAAMVRQDGWKLGWDAVALDDEGVPINGQTRLRACVRAGVPFRSNVLHGATAFAAGDAGRIRSFANWLRCQNLGNNVVAAAVTRAMWLVGNGIRPQVVDNELLYALYREEATHVEWAVQLSVGSADIRTAAVLGALAFLRRIDKENTELLAERMCCGVGLTSTMPAYWARRRLLGENSAKRDHGQHGQQIQIRMTLWAAHAQAIGLECRGTGGFDATKHIAYWMNRASAELGWFGWTPSSSA
jgi:hypothetical protein